MEVVRLDWIFAVGGASAEAGSDGQGPIVVNAFCNFLRQLKYPGDIEVTMYVANPGRSSFETFHRIARCDEPGAFYAEGGAKVVWTDYRIGRSAPMPERFRALLT
jgi:acyl-CoA thioester hydrolase